MLYDELILDHKKDLPVISDAETTWTYRELHVMVQTAAGHIRKFGVYSGDRVIIVNDNSIQTVIAILACIYLRVCFVILGSDISADQMTYMISDASPALLLGNKTVSGLPSLLFSEFMTGRDMEADCSEETDCWGKEREDSSWTERNGYAGGEAEGGYPVYILYTSGSTGKPKGVVAPESSVEFCIHAINSRLRNSESDRILCCLPFSFDYGLYQIFLCLSVGAQLVIHPGYLIQELPGLLVRERITGFPTMPAMLNLLIRTGLADKLEFPSLRYITSTGDVLSVELIRRAQVIFENAQIMPMYGLTECKRVSIMPPGRMDKTLAGSCGTPLDGTSVWLENCDPDGTGELVVAGPNVMAGYWNDPVASEQCYFIDKIHGRSLRTGDLFRIDDEGYLYFFGRKKRILKVNGHRVGCMELEELLMKEAPSEILELRVLGIPDPMAGERPAVAVFSRKEPQAVLLYVRNMVRRWAAYQRPKAVYLTEEPLPKNENGKIDDKVLFQEMMRNGYRTV